MDAHVMLNVLCHPSTPAPRGIERYDQVDEPVYRATNDDIDPRLAPDQIWRASRLLDTRDDLPLVIWHSDTCRTRRAARLFVEALGPGWSPAVQEVPELAEPEFRLRALVRRDEYEDPDRPPWLVRNAFFKAVLNDDREAVAGGRQGMSRRVEALRERLWGMEPVNMLWISHTLVMPFLHLTLVDGLEPTAWTMADVLSVPAFGYAEGFSHRFAAREIELMAAVNHTGAGA
jgi:hypothetical protein